MKLRDKQQFTPFPINKRVIISSITETNKNKALVITEME